MAASYVHDALGRTGEGQHSPSLAKREVSRHHGGPTMRWLIALWVALNSGLIVAYSVVSTVLLRRFKARYPEIAADEIPHAFEGIPHPEQGFYFYRRRAIDHFAKDPGLLRLRQWLIFLTWVLAIVPLLSFVILVAVIRLTK